MATLLVLAPVFDHLPTATLAGIVIVAGFGLFDIAEFGSLWRFRRTEFGLALLTIGGVLAVGMLIGIVIAIGLSLLVVVLRAANPHTAVLGRVPGTDTYRDVTDHADATTYPGLLLYRFDAPVFFANAPKLRDEILVHVDVRETATVVIDMESVDDVDATGVQVIGELLDELEKRGVGLELSRVRTEIRDELRIAGIEQRLSGDGIHLEVHDAVVAFLTPSASDDGEFPDANSR